MAHPFFDAVAYPWHRADADEFHKALWKSVPLPDRIDVLYKRCGAGLAPLPLTLAPDLIWKNALQQLTAAHKLRDFCDIVGQEKALEGIVPIVQNVIAAETAVYQVVLKRGLNGERAFLNRRSLRAGLERISPGDSTVGVLLVRGEPRSGRTWTCHLVESIAAELGEGPVLSIYDGNVIDVNSTLRKVFGALNKTKEAIPKQNTSPNAWYLECLQTLQEIAAERANSRKSRLWIVVDDLGETESGPKLDGEIRHFFDQFVLQMGDATFSQYFRLVLIEYPRGPVPTKWKKGFWLEDDTQSCPPKAEDVADFLLQWGQYSNKALPAEEAGRLSAHILAKAKAAGAAAFQPTDWERVHSELLTVLKGL